jgi:hypothetical protein
MSRLSPVAARELVHLLILRELVGVCRGGGVTAKGGVNLRLFFGNVRYSEDMDLDGTVEASDAIRSCLKGLFDDREFTRRLQRYGIRGLDPGEGPNKDTETTFRYKFGVIAGAGIRYPTKVEVSFRKRPEADRAVLETPSSEILDAYGLDTFAVHHYPREAAVRQKVDALAGRREPQARDVFDLHVLVPDDPTEGLLEFLAATLRHDRLEEAHARALAISYGEYKGQVFEFLGEEARSRYATESMWDEMRLRVAALIESVLKCQARE